MVPYSIQSERLEPSISSALLKQVSTACECFHMGRSLFSSLELSFSWMRLARASAIPAQESNLRTGGTRLLTRVGTRPGGSAAKELATFWDTRRCR